MIRQTQLHLFICALSVLMCGLGEVRAQNSLGVSPATVEAKVKRGSTYTQTYTLSNNTRTRMRFRCSVVDYWYDEKNERLTGRPGTLPRSASLWIQFAPTEVIVEPNSSATVRAIVTIPRVAAGGYYTMPVFEALPAEQPATPKSDVVATASIGIRFRGLVLLTTEDATEYNLEIMDAKVKPPSSSSTFEMDLDLRNRSTTHTRPKGVFAIFDTAGKLAGRGKIEGKRFLPGQRRGLKVPWAGELAPGRYMVVVTLSYDRVGTEPATLVYELPFDVGKQTTAVAQTDN